MRHKINCKLAFILLAVLISSCGKDIACVEPNPILNFVAFTDAETDSIVLRKFEKNATFNSLIDSTIIVQSNSMYEKSHDTLHIHTAGGGDYPLDINFDYEVYMPLANKLFRITNITEKQTSMKSGLNLDKRLCVNPIKSYTLNGQVISGAPDYPFIYLDK